MKFQKTKYLLCIFYIFFFASFKTGNDARKISNAQRELIIKNTTRYSPTDITIDKINISVAKNKFKEIPELFSTLHGREGYTEENEYLLANFITTNNTLGVIAYAKISECDHPIDHYYLYIIDKGGAISDPMEINCVDNSITVFEIHFKFLNESSIQISEKTSSEWVIEDNNKTDTLFTSRYKIDFLKTPFDTVETKQFQKILK